MLMSGTKRKSYPFYIPIQTLDANSTTIRSNIGFLERDNLSTHGMEVLIFDQFSEDEVPMNNFPSHVKLLFTILMIISLCIGSYFKGILYRYVFTTNKKNRGWMHRPINVLTVASAIIHHFTHIWSGLFFVIALNVETPIKDIIGFNYCQISYWIGLFGLIYLSVGSLGIAVYRALYIKLELWIKIVIGEKCLLALVLLLSIIFTSSILYFITLESNDKRSFLNTCNGHSATQAQIWIEYGLSRGHELLTTTHLKPTSIVACLVIQQIEFFIVVWFFWIRYRNDNGNIKKLLTQEAIRERNLKNVSTFVGHFYGFVTEYIYFIISLVCVYLADDKNPNWQAYANLAKILDFGLLSAVEVLSSPGLRSFMK